MGFQRADRVADLIKAEISHILLRQIQDPRLQNVTITDVEVTKDLHLAKVFFVRMGESECSDDTKEGLRSAAGFLRRELGKKVQLRYVPELMFVYDESFAYGDRIERLLAEVRTDEQEEEHETSDAGQDC